MSTRRVVFVVTCVALAGCATHFDPSHAAEPFGFFLGLWHGLIFFFALLGVCLSWLCGLAGIHRRAAATESRQARRLPETSPTFFDDGRLH